MVKANGSTRRSLDGGAVGRAVVVQHDLTLLFDGLHYVAYVRGIAAAHDGVGQNLVVVHRVELALEVLLQQVGVVDALDGAFQDDSLLLRKVYQLRYVLEMGRLLVEAYDAVVLLDDEARVAEGVDVTVDGAARHAQPLGDVIHRVEHVGREHLHQTQHPLNLGLVHRHGRRCGRISLYIA